jgi:uncharacterized membrane protein
MRLTRLIVTSAVFVTVLIAISAVTYPRLPEMMPTHFDINGRIDGRSSRALAVGLMPVILAATALLFILLPRISPKGFRLESFERAYEIIAIAIMATEFAGALALLAIGAGYSLGVDRIGNATLGILLVVIGNYLGKTTRNFFVGIRTPWTLANEEVWFRTHRAGGVVFVASGAIIVLAAFFGGRGATVVAISIVSAAALFLTIYSYFIYREIES